MKPAHFRNLDISKSCEDCNNARWIQNEDNKGFGVCMKHLFQLPTKQCDYVCDDFINFSPGELKKFEIEELISVKNPLNLLLEEVWLKDAISTAWDFREEECISGSLVLTKKGVSFTIKFEAKGISYEEIKT